MMAQNYVSKHVADLVTSSMYTFWCMLSWFYKLTIHRVHEGQLQPPRDLHKGCVPRSFKGITYRMKKLQNCASKYAVKGLRQVPVQKTV
jgi:hypothetical protein